VILPDLEVFHSGRASTSYQFKPLLAFIRLFYISTLFCHDYRHLLLDAVVPSLFGNSNHSDLSRISSYVFHAFLSAALHAYTMCGTSHYITPEYFSCLPYGRLVWSAPGAGN